MSKISKLANVIRGYDSVIIYGFDDIGTSVLDYIIEFSTNIKLANYSGKVKYFAHSFKEDRYRRTEKKGIKIKSIYNLKEYADSALVIVAMREKFHEDVTKILDELGFEHRFYVSKKLAWHLKREMDEHKRSVDTRIMQYHLKHAIKLQELRRKVETGKKVKVFFMVHDSAVFGCDSIYKEMEENELFEPYIYVVSRRDITYKDFYRKEVIRDVRFFESMGFRVICGYDDEGSPKDLHQYSPDIIFYDLPKMYGAGGVGYYRLDQLNWEYLTCYVPYGLLMIDSFYYHYHTTAIRETWRYFVDTTASFKRILADAEFNGYNAVSLGYPKFDDYFDNVHHNSILQLDVNRKTVIYAPHHSLGVSTNLATFDLYKDKMLSLVKENPDIDFILKPHPLLIYQVRIRYETGIISFSEEDYKEYIKEWESFPNGFYVESGEYIDLFIKSDCMITDCGSFIGEYLPSLHPCIYLFNPRKENQESIYTPLAKRILDTYYIANSEAELMNYFETIMLNGEDEKAEQRKQVFHSEFGSIGSAGKAICNHIIKELCLKEY